MSEQTQLRRPQEELDQPSPSSFLLRDSPPNTKLNVQSNSPRIRNIGGLPHATPVGAEIILGCGELPIAGERRGHVPGERSLKPTGDERVELATDPARLIVGIESIFQTGYWDQKSRPHADKKNCPSLSEAVKGIADKPVWD